MPPSATASTFQIGTWNPSSDAWTQVLDLNDGTTFRIHNKGLKLPQPDKIIVTSANVRTPGVVVPRWQYKERHIQVEVSLRGNNTSAILASMRALLAAIEQPPYSIRLALPGASQYSYADVLAVKHDIPSDPQILLAGAITHLHMDFTCRVGLRGDRVTLQNLVVNAGFEQPSGSAVPVFNDALANANFYASQAGSAPTVGSVNNAFPDVVMSSAPVRYYRMGEASGTTAYDSSGSGNNGTYVNTPTLSVASGVFGDSGDKAVTFASASRQRVSVPPAGLPSGNGAWSLMCAIKFAANPAATVYPVSFGTASNAQLAGIGLTSTGGIIASTFGTGNDTAATAALSLNTWHLCVATWDGTTLKVYLDGAAGPTLGLTARSLTLGGASIASTPAPGQFFNGTVDEAAFWNVALTSGQVTALWNAFNAGTGMGTTSNTLTLASGARMSFGSPAWAAVNSWQTRFRFTSGGTYRWYLHYTDANNQLYAQVTGTQLALVHRIGGVSNTLASTTLALGSNVWYWLRVTQFPAAPNEVCDVQATLYNDAAGTLTLASVGSVGPVPTSDAVTALKGAPQIDASGTSLIMGGPYSFVHTLALFGPGAWGFGATAGGSSYASGAWEQNTANTYSGGPVSSFGAARIDAPPTGAWDVLWNLYSGGAPVGTWAIAAAAGQVVAGSVWVKSSGLAASGSITLQLREYDASGNLLRTDTLASVSNNQASWTQLSGTATLGASCAYVDLECRAADATSASANATVWCDNAQLYNQTTTGASSMPWCDLRSPRSPGQLVVSGLVGDLVAPAYVAVGTYCASWAPSASMQLYAGRKLVTSPTAQLVGQSYGAYSAAYSPQSTVALDSGAWGGFVNNATVGNGSGWNPRFASPTANDAPGVYHLLARVRSAQSGGNLPNISLRVATAQQTSSWFNAPSGSDIVSTWYGPYVYPFTASNTWTVADAGQCVLPPWPQGALTNPSALYLTPRAQWQDTSVGTAVDNIDWQALLPIDGALLMATLNNPGNNNITVTQQWLWTYADGLLVNRSAPGDAAAWTTSVESGPTPNPGMGSGGAGSSSSGSININSAADPYLTLDPTQSGANGAAGVNQLVAVLADNLGGVYPLFGEVQYSPLYLYPR